MRNRLQYIFSWSKEGNYLIVYDKQKKKRVDNIRFPLGYLKFNTSLDNTICKV